MKLPHSARLLRPLACSVFFLVWQGCGDNTREKRGGLEYIDAGPVPDAGDKSDSGSTPSKDAGDDSAQDVGSGGAAGTAGASGARAGSGGAGGAAGAGRGTSGAGGRGAAGRGGAPAAGRGGQSGAPAAGAGAGGVAGVAGSSGAAGAPAAGSGGAGTTGEAGSRGQSGTGAEAGSGGEAGDGGSVVPACGANRDACGAGQFCNFLPDAQCGEFDALGACEDVPAACDAISAPVCGCDNRTHANACVTHRDGISVRHDGLCTREECLHAGGRPVLSDGASTPTCDQAEQVWSIESGGDESAVCCLPPSSTGRACGGIAGLECDSREFCNYEVAAGGQGCDGSVADAGGVCQAISTGCTFEYQPVCGCDKKTYSNVCDAHSNSMSVMHDGACTELDCAAVAGRVVYSSGPQPMCAPGEAQWTTVVDSSGAMPIESAICCRQE